jgi:hypothetical protein
MTFTVNLTLAMLLLFCKEKMAVGLMTFAVNLAFLYYFETAPGYYLYTKMAERLITFAVDLTLVLLLFRNSPGLLPNVNKAPF